jgi:hypothetical protein
MPAILMVGSFLHMLLKFLFYAPKMIMFDLRAPPG